MIQKIWGIFGPELRFELDIWTLLHEYWLNNVSQIKLSFVPFNDPFYLLYSYKSYIPFTSSKAQWSWWLGQLLGAVKIWVRVMKRKE